MSRARRPRAAAEPAASEAPPAALTAAGGAAGAGLVSAATAATLAPTLIAWQRSHGRSSLPWVGSRDPYRVWLSEIMLQQTQVSVVLGYYARFLERFADVRALAAAPQDDVLALWSGLGYYSRARNLHRCAQQVVAEFGGEFPRSAELLATLPGIGRSTAAAIAAFCFGEQVAILDGNVKRVLGRALGFAGDLAEARQERLLWQAAEALLPAPGPGGADIASYTQGLMDLGATLCTPRSPGCVACPLATLCVARTEGRPEAYPVKTRKLKRGVRSSALLLLRRADAVYLVQRPGQGVWAGLWSLPEWDTPEALEALSAGWPGRRGWLQPVVHVLTHLDWTLQLLLWELPPAVAEGPGEGTPPGLEGGRWFGLEEALGLGLPAPVRRVLEGGVGFD